MNTLMSYETKHNVPSSPVNQSTDTEKTDIPKKHNGFQTTNLKKNALTLQLPKQDYADTQYKNSLLVERTISNIHLSPDQKKGNPQKELDRLLSKVKYEQDVTASENIEAAHGKMKLPDNNRPELFIVYTWCTKDPSKLDSTQCPINDVILFKGDKPKSQILNILKTSDMAKKHKMQVLLNVDKDSMPEENFINLLKVLEDTQVKILINEPGLNFDCHGKNTLGNHVDITKAKACMDLNEKYNIPAMSVDVDMELDEDIFIPWFNGHKDTPFNFIQHPLEIENPSSFLSIENGLVYYNFSNDDKLKTKIHDMYDTMREDQTTPNQAYSTQHRSFQSYHENKYGKEYHYIFTKEECTRENIEHLNERAVIPWSITKAVAENKACTWSNDKDCSVVYPKVEDCMKLADPYKVNANASL